MGFYAQIIPHSQSCSNSRRRGLAGSLSASCIASSHHGGWTWMMSLGAGVRRAAVSLLNSAVTSALSSPGGCRRLQLTSFMPHSSRTCSTSSTSTPGLSTGEQSNDNIDVKCVWVCVCTVHAFFCALTVLCKVCFSLWDSLCIKRAIHFYDPNNSHCRIAKKEKKKGEKKTLVANKTKLDTGTLWIPQVECANVWNFTAALTVLFGHNNKANRDN